MTSNNEYIYKLCFYGFAVLCVLLYFLFQGNEIRKKQRTKYDCIVEGVITNVSMLQKPTKVEVTYKVGDTVCVKCMTIAEVNAFYSTKSLKEQAGKAMRMDLTNRVGETVVVECFEKSPYYKAYIHAKDFR